MPTLTAKKHFDEIKNISAGFFPRSVDFFLYTFTLQLLKNFLQTHYGGGYRHGLCCPTGRLILGMTATNGLCTDCPDQS